MKLFSLILVAVTFPLLSRAQRTDESVRVKVQRTVEGNQLQIEEKIPVGDAQDLEELMKKYGMSDELKELKPGEEVEIVIRRKTGGEITNDVTVEVDRKPTTIVPAPVVKPTTPIVERKKAFLGVHYEMQYGATNGSHVTKVEPGTPAFKAGLQAGDVITQADGVDLRNLDDLSAVISTKKAGDKVKLNFMRDGKFHTAIVPLAERDEAFFRNNPGGMPSYQIEEEYDLGSSSNFDAGNMPARNDIAAPAGPLLGVLMIHTNNVINGTTMVTKTDGAIVDDVIANSAATEIGLRKGDKIVVINGKHIKTSADVTGLIASMKAGERVDVEYVRDGQRRSGGGMLKRRADFDLPTEDQLRRDIEIMGMGGASEDMFDRVQRMVDDARAYAGGNAGTVREFRMVVKMDELSPAEAQALSSKTGYPIKATSDLDLRGLSISPNPSTGKFHLGFELPSKGIVRVEVMDMRGEIVYSEVVNDFQGRYSKDFDISQEAKGVYVMRVLQGGKAYTRKIVTQ